MASKPLVDVQGLALFLLLSFRTNSSYERWWEGRIVWEGMACKIQDTARIAMGKLFPQPASKPCISVSYLYSSQLHANARCGAFLDGLGLRIRIYAFSI